MLYTTEKSALKLSTELRTAIALYLKQSGLHFK